ncbi:MAG: hypothetical protein KAU58_00510, partial [Candidatus Omnitrophica bacterium]|nr:hypothetical protein [Candidatus Omnitrophota bacterium]
MEGGWIERLDRTYYRLRSDIIFKYLIYDKRFIEIFDDARRKVVRPSKEKIAHLLGYISNIEKEDFIIVHHNEAVLLCFKNRDGSIYRVIRYTPHSYVDHLSGERLNPGEQHAANIMDNGFKFELLRDRSEVLENYLEDLRMYNTPELRAHIDQLLSGDPIQVREAVYALRNIYYKGRDSKDPLERRLSECALKLLHTQMYCDDYRERIIANRTLHDIYTGRPMQFPESKKFKVVVHGENQTIEVPASFVEGKARIRWTLNGEPQRPISMNISEGKFTATIPIATGTIHYAVQVKRRHGDWHYKEIPEASGVIKSQKDISGKHILEVRIAIFDLPTDPDGRLIYNEDGSLKISSFRALKNHLSDLRKLGYNAIWLMDAFEWGPIVPPGKDPYSFAPLDHVTIARELGGEEGLRELKEEADRVGIELILNLIPHISQANTTYSAYFPVYCYSEGRLVRRAASDDLSDWHDSWQPNWRRKEVMDAYIDLAVKFAEQGFSFRANVAHAFDLTYAVEPSARGLMRLFGDIVTVDRRDDGYFKTTDLAGSTEPNVI